MMWLSLLLDYCSNSYIFMIIYFVRILVFNHKVLGKKIILILISNI